MRVHITLTDDSGNIYEGTVDLTKTSTAKTKSARKPVTPVKGRPKKATEVVHNLYIDEYFKEGQHLDEVVKKLGQLRYNFDKDTVRKALERADYLKNMGNRTYIEKYPPS